MTKIRNFYAGGNTAKGFYSFYDSALSGLNRLFILKGGPGTGKSTLMKTVGKKMYEQGFDVEYLHCSSDNNSIDGVIIPAIKMGIVDGTAPHVIEPKVPGVIEEYVNLGEAWDSDVLIKNKEKIIEITNLISTKFQTAYKTFANALKIHDEWEDIYIKNMNFEEANQLADELIQLFFGNQTLEKKSNVKDRFLGAATPKGPNDFIQNLTEDIQNRYFLKGRPGSGKSTLLKKIGAAAKDKGFDVEIYHCGFDPNSLDMIILPELSIAIFDSTAPHEYFPSREGDEIVDIYERCFPRETDEKYAEQINEIKDRYSQKMKEATSYLAEAKALHDELEKYYVQAMDFTKVEAITEKILKQFTH